MFLNIVLHLCNTFCEKKLNNNRDKSRDPLFIAYSGYSYLKVRVSSLPGQSNICIFHLSSVQDPISSPSLSVSTPTTNSAARVPINLLPPPALVSSGVPWKYSPGSLLSSPRASQRLVSSQESESRDLFRRKYWSAADWDCPWPPRLVSCDTRGSRLHNSSQRKRIILQQKNHLSFLLSSLLSTKPTQSSVSPLKVCFGRFWDKWRFSIQLWSSGCCDLITKCLYWGRHPGGTEHCLAIILF